jgi:AcrR family transcriptional regulator
MPLYYWDTKGAMLDEALIHGSQRVWVELEAELTQFDTATEKLRHVLHFCSLEGLWPIWIDIWSRALHSPEMAEGHRQLKSTFRGILRDIFSKGMDNGEFKDFDLERAIAGTTALLDGCGVQLAMGDFTMTPMRLQEVLTDITSLLVGTELTTDPWPTLDIGIRLPRPVNSVQRSGSTKPDRRSGARPDGDARRKEILTAAAEVVRERGIANTRVDDISARLGLSGAAPLYYFGTLDQLLEAALGKAEREWLDLIRGGAESLPTAAEQLAFVIEHWIPDTPSTGNWVLWVELWSYALRYSGMAALRARTDGEWRELLVGIVARGRATGEFPAGDPSTVALAASALLDGFGLMHVMEPANPASASRRACADIVGALLGAPLMPQQLERGGPDRQRGAPASAPALAAPENVDIQPPPAL